MQVFSKQPSNQSDKANHQIQIEIMTYKKYIFPFLVILCSFTACKEDFLDVEDNSFLNRQSYVKDLKSMEEFLNGIYVMLNRDFEHGIGAAYPELVADNLKPLPLDPQSLTLHYTWSQRADEASEYRAFESSLAMNGSWTTGYLIVRACSFVIEDIDKYRNENPGKADDMKGQAFAIRAMVHFKLANIFAQTYKYTSDALHPGIPYVTSSDISATSSRLTVRDVYNNIISDFTDAIQLLPANIGDARFMNQVAAKALLARTYLFKENYSAARNLAAEVAVQFPLLSIDRGYPNDIFKHKVPSQTETLFQLTPINLESPNRSSFLGRYLRGTTLRYRSTTDLAMILKENPEDIRSNWVTDVSGEWEVTKCPTDVAPEEIPAITIPGTAYYPVVIRSSEMFLTAAESSAKLGDENNARTYLNAIRKRANPTMAPVTATGPDLLDSIYKERRKELAFEGLRMYDLQRWKQGVHRIDALYQGAIDLPYPSDKAIAPIPLNDVKLAGIPQNPTY